jgi:hypothetical protein
VAARGTDMGEFILECGYFGELPHKEGLVLWAGRYSQKSVPYTFTQYSPLYASLVFYQMRRSIHAI